MKISKELKVGIVVTLAIAAAFWGFNLLKGINLFYPEREYYAVYDNVDGLVKNSPVLINGFKVGQVRKVYLHPDNSGKIIVRFSVSNTDFPITKSTLATIMSADLLGTKAINLDRDVKGIPANDGDTLKSQIEEGLKDAVDRRIEPLRQKAEGLISSIDSVMIVVQAILNQDARKNISKSFESVSKAIATLEQTAIKVDGLVESERVKLSVILSKIENITSTIAGNSESLQTALKNFASISDSIAKSNITQTVNNTNIALKNAADVLNKINNGEGSMGLLVNDKKLYNHLDSASASLDRLLDDMRLHPKRYVHFSIFGKKDSPPK